MTREVKWVSPTPKKCDLCDSPITSIFIDGRTTMQVWAIMCPTCHLEYGCGIGIGCGQVYKKASKGFIKSAG